MCGIAGVHKLSGERYPGLARGLGIMNRLQQHRGPDGEGVWDIPAAWSGLGIAASASLDIEAGKQPMRDARGNWITYIREI